MIDKRFLEPLKNYKPSTHIEKYGMINVNPEKALKFIKSLTVDEIKKLGHAIIWLYPEKIQKQLSRKRIEGVDYSFIDDFRKEFGLKNKYSIREKSEGLSLVNKINNKI